MPVLSALAPSWPDLVFHVFAHLPVPSAVPASLFDPAYVDFVANHAGPLGDRPLGQDLQRLAQLFADHRRLAHVHWLAALFDDLDAVRAVGSKELIALGPEDGCDMLVLDMLLRDPLAAELMWTTALLELPVYTALPPARFSRAAFDQQLARVAGAAPHLPACSVSHARALGRRGRVLEGRIWLGLPDDPEHTAFQAAHEATVAEVRGPLRGEWAGNRPLGQALGERDAEAVAMVLLAERSRSAGLRAEHRRWRDRWGITPEHCLPSTLTPAQRARFDALWG